MSHSPTSLIGSTPAVRRASKRPSGPAPSPLDDDACATVNVLNSITTPWLTVDKTTVGRTLDVREFFEGGLNLSETGLGGRCFNTFIATTRASQEIGANLHDFSRGELGGCDSTTVTTPSISSAEIPAHGTLAVTDSATITVTGSNDWDGSVAFFLCRSSELDASGECSTGGTPIGSAVPVTEATTMPVSSATAGLTAVDHYCWRAEFTSTTDGVPDSSDHRTSECFDVTPRQPALTTDATDGPVDFGDPISDTISLTNTADTPGTDGAGPGGTINATNRQPANGTISVTAFGPDDCVTVAHSATIPVSGDNTAYGGPGSSTEFVPAAPGVYTYVASYSGDSPNTLGVPTTACPDLTGAEVVTVRQIPTNMDTAQNFVPNDSATITVTGAGDRGRPRCLRRRSCSSRSPCHVREHASLRRVDHAPGRRPDRGGQDGHSGDVELTVSNSRCRSRLDGTTLMPRSWPRPWMKTSRIRRGSPSPETAAEYGRWMAGTGTQRLLTAFDVIGCESATSGGDVVLRNCPSVGAVSGSAGRGDGTARTVRYHASEYLRRDQAGSSTLIVRTTSGTFLLWIKGVNGTLSHQVTVGLAVT